MATSQVKRMHEANGQKVLVVGRGGRHIWCPTFENNPRIAQPGEPNTQVLINGPGLRPYIAAKSDVRWTWKEWDIAPGEIFLSDEERAFAEPYRGAILIEPMTKVISGNKSWKWGRWEEVVARSGEWFVQVGPYGTQNLYGTKFVTTTFRQALAVLSVCRAAVLPEGAFHHAAAALGVSAVVLWPHYIDPRFTGYTTQTNIRHAEGWCGSRGPCRECAASMARITVDEVLDSLNAILR